MNTTITTHTMSTLVNEAFEKCLFKDGEDTTNHVSVMGLTNNFGLHPERLEEQRELVTALLGELPEVFKQGYTFLNLCQTKNNELWTGEQRICEQLVVMAVGLDLMSYCFPREFWFALPGSVPYVQVK